MKRPSFFFDQNYGGCGCGAPQTGYAKPCAPVSGAVVCDDKYFSLNVSTQGQIMIVPSGSNCQAFLTGPVGFSGFLFYQNGVSFLTAAPQLTLPVLNPAVSGSFPLPGSWQYMTVGTGGDPAVWKHVAAPTTGEFIVMAKNGSFVLSDAGAIPGVQAIGASMLTTQKGGMLMIVDTNPGGTPTFAIRRLAVADKRVVVGDVDVMTGEQGYKTLPIGSYLEHPKAKFTELLCRTFSTLDSGGAEISGGLEQLVTYGVGALTDPVRMVYSPSVKRIMKAPPITNQQFYNSTNTTNGAVGTSYALMPGGHGQATSLNFSYPVVRVDFQARITSANAASFGLFRNGSLVQEFSTDNATQLALTFMDTSNPLGAYTYDIRQKRVGGSADFGTIGYSCLTITSVPQ